MREIKNVYIESYGCSANLNNSEIMSGILLNRGLNIVKNPKIADLAILNTCIVKGPTEQRMISRIKELSKKFKYLIVAGCMPDIYSFLIKRINPKAALLGSHHIKEIGKLIKKYIEGRLTKKDSKELISMKDEIKLNIPKIRKEKVIGITQILEGCLGNCSFCITRFAKGSLFSYPKQEIIENIKSDLESGVKEIWLTSQDNAAYGLDMESNLIDLLKEIIKIKDKFKIRLGMMNPNNIIPILNDLINIYQNEKMFKFLHIPLQSGSDSILKKMKRKYTVKDFERIIEKFRSNFPNITISTDIIIGYPSESKEDFKKTLNIIKKIKPDILNISKFWPRKETEAEKLNQLNIKEGKKRAIQLMNLHKEIMKEKNKKFIGRKENILIDKIGFENTMLGRDDNYRLITIQESKNLLGKFINIKIIKSTPHYFITKSV